jgi:hypothetical protein
VPDSPRYCAICQSYGDHHTDRHQLSDEERHRAAEMMYPKVCPLHGLRDQPGTYCNQPMGTTPSCGRVLQAVALEDCTECDGRGHYTVWPHVTCPTCKGTGRMAA